MMNSYLCKLCKTPLKIKGKIAYMACMCDEDVRMIELENIKNNISDINFYLLETPKGNLYESMEPKPIS